MQKKKCSGPTASPSRKHAERQSRLIKRHASQLGADILFWVGWGSAWVLCSARFTSSGMEFRHTTCLSLDWCRSTPPLSTPSWAKHVLMISRLEKNWYLQHSTVMCFCFVLLFIGMHTAVNSPYQPTRRKKREGWGVGRGISSCRIRMALFKCA